MIRLFTALDLPDEVAACLAPAQTGLNGARWVARENLHVTVRFVGGVDERMADEIDDALSQLKARPFTLNVTHLGSFGDAKKARSVWAGLEPSEPLARLNAKVERLFQQLGLAPDKRKYTPHITLGRVGGVSNGEVAKWIEEKGKLNCPPLEVTRLVLFSSQTRAEGAVYTPERYYVF
jgi:2'-5' RNA ligase